MDDIDYGEVFGLDLSGENGQEAAAPAQAGTGQDEKETDAAAPNGEGGQAGEAGEAPVSEETGAQGEQDKAGEGQSEQEKARDDAARRRAEAERDAAAARARREAEQAAARAVDEFIRRSGIIDPYTKKPLQNKAEYDAYQARYEAERKASMLKKAGMDEAQFDSFVENLPQVRQAKQAQAQAEQAARAVREQQARAAVEAQVQEIHGLNPEIRSLEDLTRMENYSRFYELVRRGNTLTDAYKLANYDALTQRAAKGAAQAARNAESGKRHMTATSTRGQGGVSVPEEVKEQYRALCPEATDGEIQAHYSRYHRGRS